MEKYKTKTLSTTYDENYPYSSETPDPVLPEVMALENLVISIQDSQLTTRSPVYGLRSRTHEPR